MYIMAFENWASSGFIISCTSKINLILKESQYDKVPRKLVASMWFSKIHMDKDNLFQSLYRQNLKMFVVDGVLTRMSRRTFLLCINEYFMAAPENVVYRVLFRIRNTKVKGFRSLRRAMMMKEMKIDSPVRLS